MTVKRTTLAAYPVWLAAAIFLARFELRTDDAGMVAFFILAITFLLGCLHPRHAWQWALLVGPAVPAADLLFRTSPPDQTRGIALLTAFVIALGLAGGYLGVLARKIR